MKDLIAFLAARLDEDEAAARTWLDHDRRPLREVEAHRAIIAEHGPGRRDANRCRVCAAIAHGRAARFRAPCPTLLALAAIYSDHKDYRRALAAAGEAGAA